MPRGLRNRLTIVIALGAFFGLGVLTAVFNLELRSTLDEDANRVLQAEAESGSETIEVRRDGTFEMLEPPQAEEGGARVWIFRGSRAIQRPRHPEQVQALANGLADTDGRTAESIEFDTRLYSLAVIDESEKQVGTIVAALSVEPYERSANRALVASLIFALLVLLGVIAIGRLVLERALKPVSQMTREAIEWSDHDLEHRFGVGEPYDELSGLAAAFDSMLDRLASTLRREQRLSAEISHELRTPLAAIMAETELALSDRTNREGQREALVRIQERSAKLETILETLMAASRAEIDPRRATCDAVDVVLGAIHDAEPLATAHGVSISHPSAPEQAVVDVEASLLARLLAPLLENSCRYARSRVDITVTAPPNRVEIVVADDSVGLLEDERERVFEPGFRGSASAVQGSPDGAGLGLSLVRRLTRAAGGDITVAPSASGSRFVLTLPARSS